MSSRVPDTGPQVRERERLIAYYRNKLAYFRAVPARHRDAECADEGEQTCMVMLRELGEVVD